VHRNVVPMSHVLYMGALHTGAIWRILLSDSFSTAMPPYVKLLSPLLFRYLSVFWFRALN